MPKLNPDQILAVARMKAIEMMPYFSKGVYSLIFKPSPGLGTMGVSARSVCMYDPETISEWGVENTAGVILHEIGHVLRKHHKRAQALGVTDENREAANIVMDAEIDDDLMAANVPHPETHPLIDPHNLPHKTKGARHERGQLFETYWHDLPCKGGKPNAGKGKHGGCGGCAGNPLPGEDNDGKVDGDGRSDADMERVRRQVAQDIQDHEKRHGHGSIPAGLSIWAGDQLAPPTIEWSDQLSTVVGHACQIVQGNIDYQYDRPSRRQSGFGFGEGVPILPRMVSPIPKVKIAVDTSGSMLDGVALPAALAEAQGVLDAVNATVSFMACDCEVHTQTEVETIEEILDACKGGGGTSFVPVFDAIEASGDEPDVLIFFTDGGGYAPDEPPDYTVIWVEVGAHAMRPMSQKGGSIDWGEHIVIPPDAHTRERRSA